MISTVRGAGSLGDQSDATYEDVTVTNATGSPIITEIASAYALGNAATQDRFVSAFRITERFRPRAASTGDATNWELRWTIPGQPDASLFIGALAEGVTVERTTDWQLPPVGQEAWTWAQMDGLAVGVAADLALDPGETYTLRTYDVWAELMLREVIALVQLAGPVAVEDYAETSP